MKIQIISWDSESVLGEYEGKLLPEVLGDFEDYRDVCEAVIDEIDRIYGLSSGQRMGYLRHLLNPPSSEFMKEIQKKRKNPGRKKKLQ